MFYPPVVKIAIKLSTQLECYILSFNMPRMGREKLCIGRQLTVRRKMNASKDL